MTGPVPRSGPRGQSAHTVQYEGETWAVAFPSCLMHTIFKYLLYAEHTLYSVPPYAIQLVYNPVQPISVHIRLLRKHYIDSLQGPSTHRPGRREACKIFCRTGTGSAGRTAAGWRPSSEFVAGAVGCDDSQGIRTIRPVGLPPAASRGFRTV